MDFTGPSCLQKVVTETSLSAFAAETQEKQLQLVSWILHMYQHLRVGSGWVPRAVTLQSQERGKRRSAPWEGLCGY